MFFPQVPPGSSTQGLSSWSGQCIPTANEDRGQTLLPPKTWGGGLTRKDLTTERKVHISPVDTCSQRPTQRTSLIPAGVSLPLARALWAALDPLTRSRTLSMRGSAVLSGKHSLPASSCAGLWCDLWTEVGGWSSM